MRLVALLFVVAACNEHGKRPDGGVNTCSVNCGVGSHCEAECQVGFIDGCIAPCWVTCVPDHACETIDCTVNTTCAARCTRDCDSQPEVCMEACIPPGSCALLTTELACDARTDCFVIRHGEGCTCGTNLSCTCVNPNGAFARCESIAP